MFTDPEVSRRQALRSETAGRTSVGMPIDSPKSLSVRVLRTRTIFRDPRLMKATHRSKERFTYIGFDVSESRRRRNGVRASADELRGTPLTPRYVTPSYPSTRCEGLIPLSVTMCRPPPLPFANARLYTHEPSKTRKTNFVGSLSLLRPGDCRKCGLALAQNPALQEEAKNQYTCPI